MCQNALPGSCLSLNNNNGTSCMCYVLFMYMLCFVYMDSFYPLPIMNKTHYEHKFWIRTSKYFFGILSGLFCGIGEVTWWLCLNLAPTLISTVMASFPIPTKRDKGSNFSILTNACCPWAGHPCKHEANFTMALTDVSLDAEPLAMRFILLESLLEKFWLSSFSFNLLICCVF